MRGAARDPTPAAGGERFRFFLLPRPERYLCYPLRRQAPTHVGIACDDEERLVSEAGQASGLSRRRFEIVELGFVGIDIIWPAIHCVILRQPDAGVIGRGLMAVALQTLPPEPHAQPIFPETGFRFTLVFFVGCAEAGEFVDLAGRT